MVYILQINNVSSTTRLYKQGLRQTNNDVFPSSQSFILFIRQEKKSVKRSNSCNHPAERRDGVPFCYSWVSDENEISILHLSSLFLESISFENNNM